MTLPCSLALVALRPPGAPDLPAAAAPELARRLGAERMVCGDSEAPSDALARLRAPGGPRIAAVPHDPGLPLAAGGCWAEALGAWRQPVLLLVPCPQLASGLPAAATALLQHWRVPLVGLLQWDGPWSPEARLAEGLPWLGCGAQLEDAALRLLVVRRLQRLELLPAATTP